MVEHLARSKSGEAIWFDRFRIYLFDWWGCATNRTGSSGVPCLLTTDDIANEMNLSRYRHRIIRAFLEILYA